MMAFGCSWEEKDYPVGANIKQDLPQLQGNTFITQNKQLLSARVLGLVHPDLGQKAKTGCADGLS